MTSSKSRIVKNWAAFISLFLLALITACSGGGNSAPASSEKSGQTAQASDAQGTPKSGGILKLAYIEEAENLDPIKPLGNGSIWKILLIYDTLVKATDKADGYEPGLATDWNISDDGKTFVFNLRQGVTFHDGSPVTANDVKFSLDRARGKESNWNWLYTSISSVEVTGENQVTIKTNEPYAPMLANLALFSAAIVPEKVVKDKGEEYLANHPVGSGPFIFVDWKRGRSMNLKKNPNYWEKGKPYLDGVELDNIPEDTTRMLKLRAGEIDVAEGIPYAEISNVKSDSSLNMLLDPLAGTRYIRINTTKQPFNDKKIRQAINYAIDRNAIVQAVLLGNGKPVASYLPRVLYFDDTLAPYEYDVEKAKQLMAESSKPKGFKTTLSIGAGNSSDSQMAVIIKEELAQIGIDVEILQLEEGVKMDRLNKMEHDLDASLVTSDVIDPDELTTYEVVPEGGTNSVYSGYKNPQVIDLTSKARGEMDATKRKEMYYEIQKIVKDDAPFVFLFEYPNAYATKTNVKDFKALITGNYRLENVWLDKK